MWLHVTMNKSPYSSKAAGKMGGRPLKSGLPRQRKSIAFLGEGVEVLESIAEKASISFADVLHVALLRYSKAESIENKEFISALKDKAESLESGALLHEIEKAIGS